MRKKIEVWFFDAAAIVLVGLALMSFADPGGGIGTQACDALEIIGGLAVLLYGIVRVIERIAIIKSLRGADPIEVDGPPSDRPSFSLADYLARGPQHKPFRKASELMGRLKRKKKK